MWQQVKDYILDKYRTEPDFPWRTSPDSAVFRHRDNKKWFALVMDVAAASLGLQGKESIPVINLKIDDPMYRQILFQQGGILPAYHMNKMHWITVRLDGTVPAERVFELIDMSYQTTASARKKEKIRPAKEWIVPANPKYYDVEAAFDRREIIDWKQGGGIKTGDTVFLYVAAPVSAILYRCKVTETNIPYYYEDKNLTIRSLMKIRLEQRFEADEFPLKRLKEEFHVLTVQGPRSVPNALSHALK